MIIRKKGETDKQFCQRLQAYAENLEENNRALRVFQSGNHILNPRTNKNYEQEAMQMFITLGIVYLQLKENEYEMPKIMIESQLSELGFDPVDIATGNFLKDGAYNGKEST